MTARTPALSELVIAFRGNQGLRAAAREIGISPTTLTRIERGGEPDVPTLQKLCDWLGMASEAFVGVPRGEQIVAAPIQVRPSSIVAASIKFAKDVNARGHL